MKDKNKLTVEHAYHVMPPAGESVELVLVLELGVLTDQRRYKFGVLEGPFQRATSPKLTNKHGWR